MFLARAGKKRKDGSYYTYWVIRHAFWDKKQKRVVLKNLAYLTSNKEPVIPLHKAQAIARKLGITVEKLAKIKGLRIEGLSEPRRKTQT